jgi:hypothetical protein
MSPLAVGSYAEEEAAILGHLDSEWGTETPVAWPGRPFDREAQTGPWLEPRISHQEAFRVTMGPQYRTRHPGLLLLTIHWPHGQGTHAARQKAEEAADLFRDQTLVSGLTFREPTIRDLGAEDGWLRMQATVPFWRDTDFPIPAE